MALNLPNFAAIPVEHPDYSGFANLFGNALKAYEQGRRPYQIQQEEKARELAQKWNEQKMTHEAARHPHELNLLQGQAAHQGLENEFYEPLTKAQIAHLNAQAEHASALAKNGGKKAYAPLNIEKAWTAYEEEVALNGKDSPKAKSLLAHIQKMNTAAGSGETAAVRTSNTRSFVGNVGRDVILNEYPMPDKYQGFGASKRLAQDIWKYSHTKDEKEKEELGKDLVQANVALRLLPEGGSLQVQALRLQPTNANIHANENVISKNWADLITPIMKTLPTELATKSDKEHAAAVEKIRKSQDKAYKEYKAGNQQTTENPQQQKELLFPEDANYIEESPDNFQQAFTPPEVLPNGDIVMYYKGVRKGVPPDKVKIMLSAGAKFHE